MIMRKLTFLFAVIFMIVAGVNVKAEDSDVKYDDVVVADEVAYGIVKASSCQVSPVSRCHLH